MSTFPLTSNFLKALELAHTLHHGQYRKGTEHADGPGVPYLSHLLGVASIALEFGATEAQAIAALLHDALEDGPKYTQRGADVLRTEIVAAFGSQGETIAKLIDGATEAAPATGTEKLPWEQRKREYLDRLPSEDAIALLVSASDKLHNARTILSELMVIGPAVFTRFNQGRDGTLQYYRRLADTYCDIATPEVRTNSRLQALFAELGRTVSTLETACGLTAEEVRAFPLLAARSSE